MTVSTAVEIEAMMMRRNKSSCIMSVLAVLMLSIACSTTEDMTITTASDDTSAPTDGTAAPGGGTGTPDDTPTPGDDTTAPTDSTATTDTSETSVTVGDQDSADGQESAEPASFTYEYPEFWLINRNDRSTPLGKLCWALFEYISNVLIRIYGIVAEIIPDWEVTFPAIANITADEDNSASPVEVVNEVSNELSIGTEDYFIESLGEILEPSIAGIVDDPGLSEELQLFARAFFSFIEVKEEQTKAVGWANIDLTWVPYDFEDWPHVEEFNEAVIANPDKCASPSEDEEDEMNRFLDEQHAKLEEYRESITRSLDEQEAELEEYLKETGDQ